MGFHSIPADGVVIATGNYTGNGVDDRAIPHGLGVTPKSVLIIEAATGDKWFSILDQAGSLFCSDVEQAVGTRTAVIALDATNFYLSDVGRGANINTVVYYWTATG